VFPISFATNPISGTLKTGSSKRMSISSHKQFIQKQMNFHLKVRKKFIKVLAITYQAFLAVMQQALFSLPTFSGTAERKSFSSPVKNPGLSLLLQNLFFNDQCHSPLRFVCLLSPLR